MKTKNMKSLPDGIKSWNIKKFTNAHENYTQKLDKDESYELFIPNTWTNNSTFENYRKCTENIKWTIQQSLTQQTTLRAVGSGWSFSKVCVSDNALINTQNLTLKAPLSQEDLSQEKRATGYQPANYLFAQCGNTILALNKYLESNGKSMKTSGASNGQTIVGAFSTGTHGASLTFGSLTETIKGIHVVTGPDRHFYLERATERVTSNAFHNRLGASVVIDDDLFNAALVSFGSFGFIHGVLIEVEDLYLLEQTLACLPFDEAIRKAVSKGDFSGLQDHLPYLHNDPQNPIYHFNLNINLHDFEFDNKDKYAYVRIMNKIKYAEEKKKKKPAELEEELNYGDSTSGLVQTALDKLLHLFQSHIPKIVKKIFDRVYGQHEGEIGTLGETFDSANFRGKLFSAAFAVDRKDALKMIEHAMAVSERTKLAGIMAVRFVKGTQATLGFAKWPDSCVLEFDGIEARVNHKFMKRFTKRIEEANINYTLHWGKINRILNPQRLVRIYGSNAIESWKKQRSRIMTEAVQDIFNNEFMERCDLDEFSPFNKKA